MNKADNRIPQSREERGRLRLSVAQYLDGKGIVPPVPLHGLRELALDFVKINQCDEAYLDWLIVEIHNRVWLPTISAIPYDRRLLLLPKCLSHSSGCEGEVDELGLLCHRCGRCNIPSLQDKAAQLGVLCMVAEGFTSVVELVKNQVVDAVIGVSCLDSLEKAFPLLVNHAVPGIAIPLNKSGCRDTEVDTDYVMSLLPQHAIQEIKLMNYGHLREEVEGWFSQESLSRVWNAESDNTSRVAFNWLASNGKRWRPFLLAAVYRALHGGDTFPEEVRNAAIAVECFHKASLVHDDVQDGDQERYGCPTLNALYGDAVAINIGDMLIGQGYRLLALCHHRELVAASSEAHVSLCRGQGTELEWTANPHDLTFDFVLDVFRLKTVPAFEVALTMGLICADCSGSSLREVLGRYSMALGVAYQLIDDLDDWLSDKDAPAARLSAVRAMQLQHPELSDEEVRAQMTNIVESYRQQAFNALGGVDNLELKRLLFQVTETILKKI